MFISLKTKIIFFISLVMAITAAGIMYFTFRDVGRAMLAAEKSSAQNVLQLVELNIKGGYDKLLSDKMEMIVGARKQLKSVSGVCISVLNDNAVLSEKGVLSLQDAQKRSLNWLKSVRLRKENLFVFDQNSLVIAHPDPAVLGTSIALLKDMKGRHIAREMHADKLSDSGDFAVFLWEVSGQEKASRKLGYFVPFPAWHWTVGVVLDLSDIEAQSRQKKEKIVEVLESTFAKIQIARSGYVFMFNGKGEMLIPPRGQAKGEVNLTEYAQTRNLPIADLMQAAGSKNKSMLYTETSDAGDQLLLANISYFKALDWYMVVAVPNEEIHEPANALVARQSFIIGLIFLGSLIAAYLLVSKISRPLNVLAEYVKELPVQDFIAEKDEGTPLDDLPIKYRDEVSRLAESFVIMKAELKKNIREILAAETRYRMILESIEEGFFETDPAGRWTFINDAICKMAGQSRHDLINMDIREYFTPDTLIKIHEVFNRVHRTGNPAEIGDCELITKDGTQRIVELSVYLIRNASGKPSGFRGVVRDVSDRLKAKRQKKKLKARLAQAQKMEAIGTLAGGIAHDFNNILSAIFGYTELALLKAPEGTDVKRQLNEVLRASQRAKELVSQILAFSRQSREELKPVEIQIIIKEALKLLRASLPATIEIRQHFDTEAQLIEADPTQIHQLIMNFCTNAAAAMSAAGGVLEVSLTNVEIDTPTTTLFQDIDSGSYLKLIVSDTGHGMAPDVLEKMFDPYFTTKEKGKGTGLGLAVVHGIIQRHRAAITVKSTPGKGTSFHVYFPIIKQALECDQAEAAESLPNGHECILIIDDEADVVDIRAQMLTHLGYEVVPKTCSIEGLELFRTQPDRFDLVITDMTMPKMTGDKLVKEILNVRPDIPIILCTGYSELINEEQAKKIGVMEFCLKPIGMRELARTTRKVLDQNQC